MILSSNRVHMHEWNVRLWSVDFVSETGLRLMQQLAMQHVLIVLLNGEADLELEDRVIRMSGGSAYMCPGGKTFGVSGRGAEAVAVAVFQFGIYQADPFHKDRLQKISVEPWLTPDSRVGSMTPRRLQSICRKVYKQTHHADPVGRWRAQLDFQEMLYELVAAADSDPGSDKVRALERAKVMIEESFAEDLTVDKLAEVTGFSANYFAALFKKTYGSSVSDYVAQVRMNKAKQLMLGSENLLKEIAHAVGYRDEFYFSRKFKKEFGESPTSYMKTRRNKIALYGSTVLLGYMTPLQMIPYAAPLHPKWSAEQYHVLGSEIPVHLDAYRQNLNNEDNLDKLASAQPERIICPKELNQREKEKLAAIAPVYELSLEQGNWQDELKRLAWELNRSEEAERWLHAFSRKISRQYQHVSRHLENESVLALRVCGQQVTGNCSRAVQEVLVHLLGCRLTAFPEGVTCDSMLGVNDLSRMEPDRILVLVRQDSETLAFWKGLSASPEWLTLGPVREGRLYMLSSYPWREYSPVAIERMAESAARMLTGINP